MSLPYLTSASNAQDLRDILSRDVPWEQYSTARLISDTDLSLIRRYDKRAVELRASMLDEVGHGVIILSNFFLHARMIRSLCAQAGPAHIEAFLSVLKAVTKEETVNYVLAVLVQLLQGWSHRGFDALPLMSMLRRREPDAGPAVPYAERSAPRCDPRSIHRLPEVGAIPSISASLGMRS